jgi:hypothetical protein
MSRLQLIEDSLRQCRERIEELLKERRAIINPTQDEVDACEESLYDTARDCGPEDMMGDWMWEWAVQDEVVAWREMEASDDPTYTDPD